MGRLKTGPNWEGGDCVTRNVRKRQGSARRKVAKTLSLKHGLRDGITNFLQSLISASKAKQEQAFATLKAGAIAESLATSLAGMLNY